MNTTFSWLSVYVSADYSRLGCKDLQRTNFGNSWSKNVYRPDAGSRHPTALKHWKGIFLGILLISDLFWGISLTLLRSPTAKKNLCGSLEQDFYMPDGIRDVRPTNSGKAMKALPLSKQKVQLYTETVGHLICLSVCLFALSISVDIIQDSTWPFVITAQPFLKWPRPLFRQPAEAGPCQSPRQLRFCDCGLRQTINSCQWVRWWSDLMAVEHGNYC